MLLDNVLVPRFYSILLVCLVCHRVMGLFLTYLFSLARGKWNPPEYMVYESYSDDPHVPAPHEVDYGEAKRERMDIKNKYVRKGVPFDTDEKSVWKREYDELHGQEVSWNVR